MFVVFKYISKSGALNYQILMSGDLLDRVIVHG